jgi:hypothetical protein
MIKRPTRITRRGQAYTLIEVLIAGVLVTVMMVAVWSLLRTWSNLYDKGQSRTELSQLVRSISDQFAEDIQSAVVPVPVRSSRSGSSVSATSSSSSSSDPLGDTSVGATAADPMALESEVSSFEVREVALIGGKDWLVLDVVRTPNPWQQSTDVDSDMDPQVDSGPQVYVPELQRVMYTFVGSIESDPLFGDFDSADALDAGDGFGMADMFGTPDYIDGQETTPGLLRLAMAREFVGQLDDQDELAGGRFGGTSPRTGAFQLRDQVLMVDSYDLSSAITEEQPPESEAFVIPENEEMLGDVGGVQGILEQDFIPEVSWLEFRYFSGSSWTDAWDSSRSRRLPVAVEIRFELAEVKPVEEVDVTEDGLAVLEEETLSLEEEPDVESIEDEQQLLSDDSLMGDPQTEETPYHRYVVVLGVAQPPKSASSFDLMGDVLP